MIKYIIILILIIILFYIYSSLNNKEKNINNKLTVKEKIKKENFKNYILDIKKNIENSGELDGYTMIKLVNPSVNKFVLQQDSTAEYIYEFLISLKCSKNYKLSYWKSSTDDYNGEDFFISIVENNHKGIVKNILSKPKITCRKVLAGLIWVGVEHRFKSSTSDLKIRLPRFRSKSAKKKILTGSRYFSNLKIARYYPQLDKYELHEHLTMFMMGKSDFNVGKTMLDLTQNSHVKFDIYPVIDNFGVYVENNIGMIDNPHQLFKEELSILFTYIPEEDENGSIIYVPALNDYNMGIDISIQTIGNDKHYVIVNVVNKNYVYNVGLINKPLIISVVISNNIPSLYNQGSLLSHDSSHEDKIINMGTCPDGWLYKDIGVCIPNSDKKPVEDVSESDDFSNNDYDPLENKSTDTTENVIKDFNLGKNSNDCKEYTFDIKKHYNGRKKDWADKCDINWTNCKKIKKGEIAPTNNNSCKKNKKLDFVNSPIIINKDKELSGRLYNLIFYEKALNSNEVAYIYEYLSTMIISGDDGLDDTLARPSLSNTRLHVFSKHNEYSTASQTGVGDSESAQFSTCNIAKQAGDNLTDSGTYIEPTEAENTDILGARDLSISQGKTDNSNVTQINSCIAKYSNTPRTKTKCKNCSDDIDFST